MGLDISHDTWHGAYSAFMRWREKIAELVGVPLRLMEGFYSAPGGDSWEKLMNGKDIDGFGAAWPFNSYYREVSKGLPIKWEWLKPDPLHVLLVHSDCDGEISPEDAAKIADRLESLLPVLPSGEAMGHIGNWKDKTAQFIEGCRRAAAAGEPLDFH